MSNGLGSFGRVVLRPHSEADIALDRAEFQGHQGWGDFEWFGYSDPSWLANEFAASGLLTERLGRLVIECNGEWAGRVTWWNAARTQVGPIWCIAVIVKPSLRGTGIGTDAHVALVDYLFGHTRADRVEAFTDVENLAEQRVLEKSSFSLEGRSRSALWRQGAWRDVLTYAILRSDPR